MVACSAFRMANVTTNENTIVDAVGEQLLAEQAQPATVEQALL